MGESLLSEELITKLTSEPNAQFGLVLSLQQHLASQNTQFMIDLARQMKSGYTASAAALHIATRFFHLKCYVHYDRLLLLTASYLLASKLKNVQCRLKNLCHCFFNTVQARTPQLHQPYNEEKFKAIKNQLSIYESEILRTLEFEVDVTTPVEYLRKECEIMFLKEKEVSRRVFSTTRTLIIDSYRVRASLVFGPLVVLAACLLISCRYEGRKPYDGQWSRERSSESSEAFEGWLTGLGQRYSQVLYSKEVVECLKLLNSLLLTLPLA